MKNVQVHIIHGLLELHFQYYLFIQTSLVACPYRATFVKAIQGDLDADSLNKCMSETAQDLKVFSERLWKFLKENECDNLP